MTFVIAGGNSGIGLQAAREILVAGHRVILLGRDLRKGKDALNSFGAARDRAAFLSVDLSTHDGVQDPARLISEMADRIDGVLHATGVFTTRDIRTVDGLTLFFSVTYLSRYHLTQLLLPALLRADRPRVVMLTAKLNPVPKIDLKLFPRFVNYDFRKMGPQINAATLYYADHLSKAEPKLFVGVVNAGFAQTDIFRDAPWYLRAFVTVAGPFLANSIKSSAHNAVAAILKGEGSPAFYWNKPGHYEDRVSIDVDSSTRDSLMRMSVEVTGV